jgi:DNA-binding transcriptional ArsR family regulator
VARTTTAKASQRDKSIEEVVTYALSHRTRVYVLTILNEGTFTPDQIARIVGQPLNTVSHHIKELLEAGSIELAKTERVRNATQHYYRAVQQPYYSDEETAAMTPQQRQVIIGLIIQCLTAEALAAFWAGKMHSDPRIRLSWRWFNLDAQGRDDLADEQERHWERVREIEVEATNRRAKSGEDARSIVVAQMGFERERTGPTLPPESADAE